MFFQCISRFSLPPRDIPESGKDSHTHILSPTQILCSSSHACSQTADSNRDVSYHLENSTDSQLEGGRVAMGLCRFGAWGAVEVEPEAKRPSSGAAVDLAVIDNSVGTSPQWFHVLQGGTSSPAIKR